MSGVTNINYSLLSQEEVDTLVGFLMEKKNNLDTSVMSQSSIDRLIQLLRNDRKHVKHILIDSMAHVDATLLNSLEFRTKDSQDCVISCKIEEDTNQILLFVHNKDTGEDMPIKPSTLTEGDGESWGCCLLPSVFVRLVIALAVKCSRETYDLVCSSYAKCVFGDENAQLPSIYLPDNESLLEILD